jgi:translation initiation factor 2 beta subunit (eIF-2beta)/eIF-5
MGPGEIARLRKALRPPATHQASGEEVDFLRRDEAPAKPEDLVKFITNTFMSNIKTKNRTAK